MARFERLQVYQVLLQSGLVPLFYCPEADVAKKIAEAAAEGGAKVIEFTNRGDRALDVYKSLNEFCAAQRKDVILGVGSVLDAPTAALYIAAGANYIVAPLFDAETARLCNRRKIPYLPGVGSVTEISKAEEWGAEIVKLFPGKEVGGPGFIKAVKGPMPWTRIMPTGGVEATRDSIRAWIDAGACAVGMGSNLITKEMLAGKDIAVLAERVHTCLEWIHEKAG